MTAAVHARAIAALARNPRRIIACSGGVDSLLLADLAHEAAPASTLVAHSVTPAVPRAATERVRRAADDLGWDVRLIESGEFADERYLANPVDRCYFCKDNLYDVLDRMATELEGMSSGWTLMSGANTDDLGEYRPGLAAAAEYRVAHPFVEASLGKDDIRALARSRGRDWHDLPAAPCLASRLYTGTSVTPSLLRAVEVGELALTRSTGLRVVRCRIRGTEVVVEVTGEGRASVDDDHLNIVLAAMQAEAPELSSIHVDPLPYAPGRSFVRLSTGQAQSRSGVSAD
jgi:uncharacterized protein